MAFGLGFGIGFCRRFGAVASDPGTIEGTPVSIAQGVEGETLADVVTWGSMTATVGTLGSPVREMRLNAGSWATYVSTTALVHPDEWDVRESWESTSGATRTDTAGPMTVVGEPEPASAPEVLDHENTVSTAALSHSITLPTATAGQVYFGEICTDGHDAVSGLTGWTIHENVTIGPDDTNGYRRQVVSKTASGSDTLTITLPGGESCSAKMLLLTAGSTITAGTMVETSDPPSLDLGTSAPTLWLAVASHDGTASHVGTGSPPTGYAFVGAVAQFTTNTTAAAAHIAQKTSTAQTDDPDAFSVMGARPAVNTYGVRL